jgi:hypothetical protein
MQSARRKAAELAVIERVARALGGSVVPADSDPPDAYLLLPDEVAPIPVEVVRTYQWPHDVIPDPRGGAPAARAAADVERQERALRAAGHTAILSYVHDAREAVVAPAESMPRLRLPVAPLNPLQDVSLAVWFKGQKPYAPGTILVVDYRDGFPLEPHELRAIGKFARIYASAFREVWVCPELVDYAQRAAADDDGSE